MDGFSLLPVFMIGLLGSVHCVGMCGGIVSAFSIASEPMKRPFKKIPIAAVAQVRAMPDGHLLEKAWRVMAYNIGRIGSYATAGAIAGGVVGGMRQLVNISTLQVGGYWLANLMLVALGLYLMDAWRGLTQLESAGQSIWRRIQPLMRHFLPLDRPWKMLAVGALWGWLPCGMVYSVLTTAMLTGSAASGAMVMLAFGLGTLPTLLTLGMFGMQWKSWMQRRQVRVISGVIVLLFGVAGLMRAANGISMGWLDSFCITPHAVAGKL
jgi:hypothetical protein